MGKRNNQGGIVASRLPEEQCCPDINWRREMWVYFSVWLVLTVVFAGWIPLFLSQVKSTWRVLAMLNQTTYAIYHVAVLPAAMAMFIATSRYARPCRVRIRSRLARAIYTGGRLSILAVMIYGAYRYVQDEYYDDVISPYQLLDDNAGLSTQHELAEDFHKLQQKREEGITDEYKAARVAHQKAVNAFVDTLSAAASHPATKQNDTGLYNCIYTAIVMSFGAFVACRFLELLLSFLAGPIAGRGECICTLRCFRRSCVLPFLSLLFLAMLWLPLRVYASWSETFFLGTVQTESISPIVIFIVIFSTILGLISIMFLGVSESTADSGHLRLLKILAVGICCTLLTVVVLPNNKRDELFFDIYQSLAESPAFKWVYIGVACVIWVSCTGLCLIIVRGWIGVMPASCIFKDINQLTSVFNVYKQRTGDKSVESVCDITVNVLLNLHRTKPYKELRGIYPEIENALKKARLV